MNVRNIALSLSVAGNVLLCWGLLSQPERPVPKLSAGVQSPLKEGLPPATSNGIISPGAVPAAPWMQDYQSHEFSSLVSKLRAQNFSPALVRSIVVAAVDDYYAPKLKAARRKRPAFWENRERSRDSTGTALPDSVAVGLERNQLLKSLLGEDASADKEEALELRTEHFGIASYEKVQALQMIVADYDQIRAQIDADYRTKPIPDAQFDQRLQILETEKRADLERLLSPTELLEYELRNSPSAQEVRAMLRWFDPTEDEFRRLFAVQKAYDDKYPERFSESPERTKARLAARANLPIEFKNALGEARYAELMADPANKR